MTLHHATAKKRDALLSALASDYPAISVVFGYNEDESKIVSSTVLWTDPETEEQHEIETLESPKVPALADVLEAVQEAGHDPEAGFEEEETVSGSVVRETYRKLYAESSTNKQTCGDWLAETLVAWANGGKLDIEVLAMIFSQNGLPVDTARWASQWREAEQGGQPSNGWQGRFRMSGRLALEKIVAKTGFLFDHTGSKTIVPEEALAELRAKHEKWLAKEAKRDEAEEAVAEAAAG